MTAQTQIANTDGRKAAGVLLATFLLPAPIGVIVSVAYRAGIALESWAMGSPYAPEQLEFLKPESILAAILWTYIVCAIPVLITAAALAWRTWNTGTFSYLYAAAVASFSMAVYMATAAYVFRHELVRVVTEDTAIDGVVYAVLVAIVSTALLRLEGVAQRET